ncbi:MAG: DNA-3-methyladenine glycosylase 2 family protein [Eggerthellaceae bacterium]|nr:DNA-3-methyladenine glycosylase 2 family protein [Eggerthellaceae bacterium]
MSCIAIKDDIDFRKIIDSGQVFTGCVLEEEKFLFITRKHFIVIKQMDEESYDISCQKKTWEEIWVPYFDLVTDYRKINHPLIKELKSNRDEFLLNSLQFSRGIRILNQDPWEMLISFIISQRKGIPAIRTSIEKLSRFFGKQIYECEKDRFFLFPTPEALYKAQDSKLAQCALGYRLKYVKDAARAVHSKELDLNAISSLQDYELREALKTVSGVGDKVANCIMLFAYSRGNSVPVDTWINKIIEGQYSGKNPFFKYGKHAGLLQQYAFYFMQKNK